MRWASCKGVLCLRLNPNSSSRNSPRSPTSWKILPNRIYLNSLPIVSKRLMGRYDECSAGSFPGLRIEITRACFHTVGKWWVRRTALKIWAKMDTARRGSCFKALFGIPFGPWTWPFAGQNDLLLYRSLLFDMLCHLLVAEVGRYHLLN